jgi:PAS domain S-box-containing protein
VFWRRSPLAGIQRSIRLRYALGVAVAYYIGATIGIALNPRQQGISAVWPPNAIVMGALLLAPVRAWPVVVLATFPAHMVVQLQNGVPVSMALCWFISNSAEALLGAGLIRWLIHGPIRLDSFRRVGIFVLFGALFAPFASSFLDVWFVRLNDWGSGGFWENWRIRFLSNVLAILAIVPVMVTWKNLGIHSLRSATARRVLEASFLAASLMVACTFVLIDPPSDALATPELLCVPLPFLLWSAVRFGPAGSSACLLMFTLLSVWSTIHGQGPFIGRSLGENVLSVQVFLIVTYVPLLALSAVIGERGRAEDQARRKEEQLNLALSAAHVGAWDWDISNDSATWSGKAREIFGVPTGEGAVTTRDFLGVVKAEDRPMLEAVMNHAFVEPPDTFEVEYRVVRPDGAIRWVLSRGKVVEGDGGRPVRMLGVSADITESKLAEAALRSSEERFAKAFRASPDAILIARQPEGRIVEINERWQTMFGFTRAEAIGRTIDELRIFAHQVDIDRFGASMASQGYVREFELDMRNGAGEILRAVLASETVDVGGEPCLITLIRDITERRRAEHEVAAQRQQLAHLGRVAVLGELSGALAHELNQPLTAILANARAAQRMLQRDNVDMTELRAILDDIVSDDRRAGAVIHRMRALIRKGDTEPQQVVANEVVSEVLDLAHSDLILREVTVTTRLSPALPAITADRVQLQQVVLNLIVNACDAMADNPPTERALTISTADEGSAVRLSVSDRGTGITSDAVDTVFEPFVTSKKHGLGLGLSICRSIVDAHGGRMWAVNNEERGATFHLLLPRSRSGELIDARAVL